MDPPHATRATPAARADGDGSPGLSPRRSPPVHGILTQWYRAGPEAELRADLDRSDSGAQQSTGTFSARADKRGQFQQWTLM